MRKNHILLDIAVGSGLVFLLLTIFVVDRLLNPVSAQNQAMAQAGSTLLGDDRIATQIKALGDIERLEKLKVVRLTTKAHFANAPNVNDIIISWCWEPNMVIRFQEDSPQLAANIANKISLGGFAARQMILNDLKRSMDFGGNLQLEQQLDQSVDGLIAANNYQPFGDAVVLLEGKQAYRIFNKSVAIPVQPVHAVSMRNLCFALSISNLIPISRHKFKIDTGNPQQVRDRMCDQFLIQDPDGLSLQFFFDQQTKLLAKISHLGHEPRPGFPQSNQVLWEHNFSDYQETDGIKQWRHEDLYLNSQLFSTLEVTDVRFFDEMQPELKRPGH